jgi:Ca2+-binding EF-hand superfamily protein
MDYDMFNSVISSFNTSNDFCKTNKTKISETQAKACFLLLDLDESGELEQEEVIEVLSDRQQLGQNRES